MKTDGCREWRESARRLRARPSAPRRSAPALEAHLEGCPSCRAELEQLAALVQPMSLADPARFESAPQLPATLGGAGRRGDRPRAARPAAPAPALRPRPRRRRGRRRDRRWSSSSSPGGAKRRAPSSTSPSPRCRSGTKISAKLIPNAFGTEIHMYVKGVSLGDPLPRLPAQPRRHRCSRPAPSATAGGDGSFPILSSGARPLEDRGDGGAGRRPHLRRHGRRRLRNNIEPDPGGTTMTRRHLAADRAGARAAGCGCAAPPARGGTQRQLRPPVAAPTAAAATTDDPAGESGPGRPPARSSRWRRCRSWARSSSTPTASPSTTSTRTRGRRPAATAAAPGSGRR